MVVTIMLQLDLHENIVYSFMPCLAAASMMLPISRIIEVKSLPTRRDSATLHSGVADCIHLLIIPFIRVLIINFNHGEGISKQNKTR